MGRSASNKIDAMIAYDLDIWGRWKYVPRLEYSVVSLPTPATKYSRALHEIQFGQSTESFSELVSCPGTEKRPGILYDAY